MIGAARPSIADPFLPNKIRDGRPEDIRECIGCNVCVTGDYNMTPARCTQNPAMGEEFRKGWHPDRIRPAASKRHVLIVGAGPAGLEAARALGSRGHQVTLTDAAREAGGRVARECRLPGLSAWGRVRDWRLGQIDKLANVSLYLESEMTAEAIAEVGADHVVMATGASWRRDGTGRNTATPLAVVPGAEVLTPDDLLAGRRPGSKLVTLYDDDHFYLGGVLAELLSKEGFTVTLVTPAALVSIHTRLTMEQSTIQSRLINMGVRIVANTALAGVAPGHVTLACGFTGKQTQVETGATVLVTARYPNDGLLAELKASGIAATAIGDCLAPATIAAAVYAGRKFAEGYGEPQPDFLTTPYHREVIALS